ncbi:MAG: AMP-binding protein [Candidatus Endonucleobacter sp. (ex Gigantidas childressi)]|nr:AMP-binding protein [Candidatus Endonucleobacter sp. (ex Gigantidas childressi)]
MDKSFWSEKRPAGVSNSINMDEYSSILSVIEGMLSNNEQKPAFTSIGHTLSYSDIDKYSKYFASYLQNYTDLKPGDRIAIQIPNLLQFPIAVYGAIRAGLIIVNTNPLYTAREMNHQFNDSGARALVFLDSFGRSVEEIIDNTNIKYLICTRLADMLPLPKRTMINFVVKHIKKMVPPFTIAGMVPFLTTLKQGAIARYNPPPSVPLDTPVVLQYTGGTTGISKGAILTQRNLIANMLQVREVLSQKDGTGNKILEYGKEIIIAPLPLYHIYAFTIHILCLPLMGHHSIFIANPRDTTTFIKHIKRWNFTGFIGLNTLFVSLLNHINLSKRDFSSLKFTLSGGTALQKNIGQQWEAFTSCKISEAYGLTECSPAVCVNPLGELPQLGTAGLPIPDTFLKTIDKNGDETPLGVPGELCIKGPQVMKGYWQQPEATADVLDADGWLKTGDIATIQEDGFVKIVDRLKDMIIVSGFNVYPNEVESVASSSKKVKNCAAIGVPDDKTGERVKLFVVASDKSLTSEELINHCRKYLTAYKVPRDVEFRTELPMTPVGKVLRKDLRS